VAGDVSAFDAATFKAKLAGLSKVRVEQVTIDIAPASVAVTTHISVDNSAAAAGVSATLSKSSAALSTSLGVQVLQVSGVGVQVRLVLGHVPPSALAQARAAPPPSTPHAPPTPIWAVLLGSFFASALALAVAGVGLRHRQRRRRQHLLFGMSLKEDASLQQLEHKTERRSRHELVADAAGI